MLVTHDMGVIAETADRVAVMYAGRIAEIGPVTEVIHRPRHPYTAGLMGSIPTIGEERARLEQIDGSMPRLDAIPEGCAFNPRCQRVMPICRSKRPPLMPAGASLAACWLHEPGQRAESDPPHPRIPLSQGDIDGLAPDGGIAGLRPVDRVDTAQTGRTEPAPPAGTEPTPPAGTEPRSPVGIDRAPSVVTEPRSPVRTDTMPRYRTEAAPPQRTGRPMRTADGGLAAPGTDAAP